MSHRFHLQVLITIVALVGVVFFSIPFIRSMLPSERAVSNLPHVNISAISPGQFVLLEHPRPYEIWKGYLLSILVYRRSIDSVIVWEVPARGGSVGMPDRHWWRPFYDCENFGPTFINGVVDESQPIKCHDSTMPSKWWSEHWQWSIEGKNLAGFVDDLKRAEGEIHGEYFVIGQNS